MEPDLLILIPKFGPSLDVFRMSRKQLGTCFALVGNRVNKFDYIDSVLFDSDKQVVTHSNEFKQVRISAKQVRNRFQIN